MRLTSILRTINWIRHLKNLPCQYFENFTIEFDLCPQLQSTVLDSWEELVIALAIIETIIDFELAIKDCLSRSITVSCTDRGCQHIAYEKSDPLMFSTFWNSSRLPKLVICQKWDVLNNWYSRWKMKRSPFYRTRFNHYQYFQGSWWCGDSDHPVGNMMTGWHDIDRGDSACLTGGSC